MGSWFRKKWANNRRCQVRLRDAGKRQSSDFKFLRRAAEKRAAKEEPGGEGNRSVAIP